MDLHEKIYLHRVNKLEQLTPLELEQYKTDQAAQAALKENQAFAELSALELAQPHRAKMLAAVFAPETQETWTPAPPKHAWWRSRHTVRWAVSASLILVAVGALVITPSPTHNGNSTIPTISTAQPAWASEPGLLLAGDAEVSSVEEALRLAQELTKEAQAAFSLQSEELSKQEAILNDAAVALEKQRQFLSQNHPPRRVEFELSQAERASLEELKLELLDVHKELEQNYDGLKRLQEKLAQDEAEVFEKLQVLYSKKGNLYKVKRYAPKHEVRKLENGNFSITVGFPGVEVAPADIAVNLSGIVNYEVNVSPAMFFVREISASSATEVPRPAKTGNVQRSPFESLAPYDSIDQRHAEYEVHSTFEVHGTADGHLTHNSLHHKTAPSPDAVRFGLAKSMFFSAEGSELEVSTDSNGDKLVVLIRREGELLHKIESNDLGEGMVYFGMPHLKHLGEYGKYHNLHLESVESLGCVIEHNGEEGETSIDLEISIGGLSGEASVSTGHGAIAWTSSSSVDLSQVPGLEALRLAPGVINLSELGGKIVSILGDVNDGQKVEVVTTQKDGVRIMKIVINGEVTQEIHLTDGECEVVVVSEGEKEGE